MRKGRVYAQQFLDEHCSMVEASEDDFQTHGLNSFLQFLEPMRGVAGTVHLGITTWPEIPKIIFLHFIYFVAPSLASGSQCFRQWPHTNHSLQACDCKLGCHCLPSQRGARQGGFSRSWGQSVRWQVLTVGGWCFQFSRIKPMKPLLSSTDEPSKIPSWSSI